MHRPRKSLGQHFLHARPIIARIIAAIAPEADQQLIEIGPGLGAITAPLLASGIELEAIEIDRDLIPILNDLADTVGGRLRVHHADVLDYDFCGTARSGTTGLRIVGNLPYNISTPLLFRLLEQRRCIRDMHFMLQKEVVDRMAAPPGGKDYGRLSVMVQYHCEVHRLFTIEPGAFKPPPRVESAFVRLIPHRQAPVNVDNQDIFMEVVKKAFGQRRKILRNSLRDMLDDKGFSSAGIDPGRRAEQLGLDEFARLSNQATGKL